MQRLNKDQIDKLRGAFNDHPFFLDVQSAFNALLPLCGERTSFMRYDAQLFHSASILLDRIISHDDIVTVRLWTDLRADFQDSTQMLDKHFNEEIAMLLSVVANTVEVVPGLEKSIRLADTLLELIRIHLDKDLGYLFSIATHKALHEHEQDVHKWLKDYTSGPTLTQQIEDVLKPKKAKKQPMPKADPPNTLDYINNDPNDRVTRIDYLRKAWEYWKWIEEGTDVRDFERFFEYNKNSPSYDCHISWIAPANVLCMLLKRLIESGLFKKHNKCTIKHIAKSQFQKTYDSRYKSIDEPTLENIELSISILNPNITLQSFQRSNRQEDNDDNSMTLGDIMENGMSIRKR